MRLIWVLWLRLVDQPRENESFHWRFHRGKVSTYIILFSKIRSIPRYMAYFMSHWIWEGQNLPRSIPNKFGLEQIDCCMKLDCCLKSASTNNIVVGISIFRLTIAIVVGVTLCLWPIVYIIFRRFFYGCHIRKCILKRDLSQPDITVY